MRIELSHGLEGELSISWDDEGCTQLVDPFLVERLDRLAALVAEAELERRSWQITETRRELGRALFDLLEGPNRELTQQLERANAKGASLPLTVVLQGSAGPLANHPGAAWRFELLADEHSPLLVQRTVTMAVQLGNARTSEPNALEFGGLRILFMAYSPRDVQPELDFEAEEERVLDALSPFISSGRAHVRVVEFGSLSDLGRALSDRYYDVVHLSGHGVLAGEGPRLLMEDEVGDLVTVSPEELLHVLKQACKIPQLVMISSCLSAGEREDTPSLTAQLVAGGVPTVIGWAQPVLDRVATQAAADIYQCLCIGKTPAEAVAFARTQLYQADQDLHSFQRSHAWGTLHLVTCDAAGFRLDAGKPPLEIDADNREDTYRYLDEQGRMRVLSRGFVGRRRPLQRLLRVLLGESSGDTPRSGAVIFGNKGTGKSCLVARALDRCGADLSNAAELDLVVLHGQIDDALLYEQLERLVQRGEDNPRVRAVLADSDYSLLERLRRLLASHCVQRRVIFVLDDFEHNLEIPTEGLARLSNYASALFDVLLPACQAGTSKLVITTTARFELPAGEPASKELVEIGLGGFERPSLQKLWIRGQIGGSGELAEVPENDWMALGERLSGNPRLLDWVRTLLSGRTPMEVQQLITMVGADTPAWDRDKMPTQAQQTELARLFLQHMAYNEAVARISEDARIFLRRARVFKIAVPHNALVALCDGLELDLERVVPALQNLGLLEAGEFEGEPAARVSPLVEPEFVLPDAGRWHGVAAEFWALPERHRGRLGRVRMAWEHALMGRREQLAGELSTWILSYLDLASLFFESLRLAEEHLHVFPDSETGLMWKGYALFQAGDPVEGWALLEEAEAMAAMHGTSGRNLSRILDISGRILRVLGRLEEAAKRFTRAIEIAEHAPKDVSSANLLHSLATVRFDQGDISSARDCLEKCLAMYSAFYQGDEYSDVATALHELGRVLLAQGDVSGARKSLERSLSAKKKLFGADGNIHIAVTLNELASALFAQGDLSNAQRNLERALSIYADVFRTDEHPAVATSLQSLAAVLATRGDLSSAQEILERSLAIRIKLFGTDEHKDVAASLRSLAAIYYARSNLSQALATIRRSLAVDTKLLGSEVHPNIAASLHSLACMLASDGQADGAIETFRRKLRIDSQIYGTQDHYASANTEVDLAALLLKVGHAEEAKQLLHHAMTVLAAQVPAHPRVAKIRQLLRELGARK